MAAKAFLLSFILLTTAFFACRKQIGKWEDNIQLSGREFNFKSSGDSATITAKGNWWGVNCVSLDTNSINVYASSTDNCNFSYTDSNIEIEGKDCNHLFVKLNANIASSDRTLVIGLWAGDYHDAIKIVQAKK